MSLKATSTNTIQPSATQKSNFDLSFGCKTEEKLYSLKKIFESNPDVDGYLVCDPANVSWLINERAYDNDSLSVHHSAFITQNMEIMLLDEIIFPPAREKHNLLETYTKITQMLHDISPMNRVVLCDSVTLSKICQAYQQNEKECSILYTENHILQQRSIKNAAEIESCKKLQRLDALVVSEFITWIHKHAGTITHLQAQEALLRIRKSHPEYIRESFPMIIASQQHSAEIHYDLRQHPNEIIHSWLMLDIGAQYYGATTDMTRTICLHDHPSETQKQAYTAVLKGHIALCTAKVLSTTSSSNIDTIARHHLWKIGYDYPHATGHGVAMMGPVHETPPVISPRAQQPLQQNMLLSNEPGFYSADFGVRLEGLMITTIAPDSNYLCFDMLTFIPFDEKLIIQQELTYAEKIWLDEYHHQCSMIVV